MAVQWGLGQGNNALNMFQYGAQLGQQVRERRDATEQKNALTAYATNPNAPGAFEGLAQADPTMAIKARGDMERRQREAQVGQLQARAAQGDTAALGELAGVDINAWNTLSDQQLAVAKQGNEAIGNAALAVSQVPEGQRAAAWDSYIGELARQYPQLAQYQGRYSPQALEAVIAQAGYTKQLIDLRQPSYQAVPYDSTLVNTRDPNAVAAFAGGTPLQQGAQQQAQPAMTREQGMQAMRRAEQAGQMTSEEADILRRSLAPAQFDQYIQSRNIAITKQMDGQTYYQIGGRWFDNPEGR